MMRYISPSVVKKILAPLHRRHALVGTPGLTIIADTLFAHSDVNVSPHEEDMIRRALELAWLDGASIIAATTETPVLEHRRPW